MPATGPLNALVPPETAEAWITRLIRRPPPHRAAFFAIAQLARETGDRYRDISEETRLEATHWLIRHAAPARFLDLMQENAAMNAAETAQVFGEALPPGLHLR